MKRCQKYTLMHLLLSSYALIGTFASTYYQIYLHVNLHHARHGQAC